MLSDLVDKMARRAPHDCLPPNRWSKQIGEVWACPDTDCGRHWRLQYRSLGGPEPRPTWCRDRVWAFLARELWAGTKVYAAVNTTSFAVFVGGGLMALTLLTVALVWGGQ